MDNINKSISCDVGTCQNHCKGENYCTLNSIHVGAPLNNPQTCSCTECDSFTPCNNSMGNR